MHELHRMIMECIKLNNLEYGQIATTAGPNLAILYSKLFRTNQKPKPNLLASCWGVHMCVCKLANSVTCSLNEFLNANVCKSMNISDPKSAATSGWLGVKVRPGLGLI